MTLVLAILLLIVIVAKPEIMLFIIGMAYLVSGPIAYYLRWRNGRLEKKQTPAES
jgi:CDP-diacylglycerol--serine O-phosphatidyltransferase